jgi:hypothetical protein
MQVCAVLSVGAAILLTVPNPPIFFGVPIQRVLTFLLLGLYVAVFYFWRQL